MTDHPCQEAPARPYYGRNDVYVAQAIDESPEWLGRVLGYLSIQPDGCWLWTRSKTADGYGRVCPTVHIECGGCRAVDVDLFPGRIREWDEQ